MPATAVLAPDRSSPSQELEWMPTPVDALEPHQSLQSMTKMRGISFTSMTKMTTMTRTRTTASFSTTMKKTKKMKRTTTSWSPTKMSHPKMTMMKAGQALVTMTTRNMSLRIKPLLQSSPAR